MTDDQTQNLLFVLTKIERHMAAISAALNAIAREKSPGWENPIEPNRGGQEKRE